MINVAAIRMQQFGVQFYQAALTASDIDKLVRFEVLNYGESGQPVKKRVPNRIAWSRILIISWGPSIPLGKPGKFSTSVVVIS